MLSLKAATKLATRRTAIPAVGAIRNLNVHEYISMELMNHHKIATPDGYCATNAEEAENIYLHELNHGASICYNWDLLGRLKL